LFSLGKDENENLEPCQIAHGSHRTRTNKLPLLRSLVWMC